MVQKTTVRSEKAAFRRYEHARDSLGTVRPSTVRARYRSVRQMIVRRLMTVAVLFVVVLFGATPIPCITEASSHFAMMQIFFKVAPALGTVGLTTGIKPSLAMANKLIIVLVMLAGCFGPLRLLAALAFDTKPVRCNYPNEAIVVG
jgi:trk system potassium uptake protein TrkH